MAWGLVGHERPIELLWVAFTESRLPRAQLFTGPRGVGKRTLALALARAVNCTGSTPPCGICRPCRLSAEGGYPDVELIELRDGRQRIGIKDIQELQSTLARRPSEGLWRVAVIADAERLSAEAENCLLKTLEEPPPYALLILTATEAEALLPTTVSRCQRIRLRPVATALLIEHLRQTIGLPEARARLLAGLAEGRPGWAIAAARDPSRVDAHEAALARLVDATEGGKLARLQASKTLAENWSGKAEQVRDELTIWSRWWRDLLLIQLGLEHHAAHLDRLDDLRQQSTRFSIGELRGAITTLVQARADLDQNVNPRLALDVALLRLPRPRQADSPRRGAESAVTSR
jgi:DNA polymerase-3 subunit delta'